jgi:glycosyltransferase involved in cell wall biosynthesis
MDKYTAVIPTMLKSPRLKKLAEDLQNSEYVDEVIIIDNSGNLEPSLEPHPKQKYICEGKNTGCNPAWNKGVRLSSNELIVICNDDINFDPIILGALTDDVVEYTGVIGMGAGNYDENFDNSQNPYLEQWFPGVNDHGWGSLMMLKKSMWVDIPENIIVWYGDNFIKEVNSVKKSILRGFKVETEMSTTTDLPELNEIKNQDKINYFNYLRQWNDYQSR